MKISRHLTIVMISLSFIGSLGAMYEEPDRDYTNSNITTQNADPEYDNLEPAYGDKYQTDAMPGNDNY